MLGVGCPHMEFVSVLLPRSILDELQIEHNSSLQLNIGALKHTLSGFGTQLLPDQFRSVSPCGPDAFLPLSTPGIVMKTKSRASDKDS
eukprot:2038852-Pleurochrysis_carterae.AAC.1